MNTEEFLLDQLRQPGFLGGDELGNQLGISRVSISKHMNALRKKGLPLESVPGKGYKLEEGVYLLHSGTIQAHLSAGLADHLAELHIHQQLESTNQWLADQPFYENQAVVCLAEAQLAGRGRRERQWHSSPYRNLLYSLSWRFANWPNSLPSASLLAGLVVAEALEICGVPEAKIKWPNDIYLNDKKLGGILVSAKGEANGACDLVIGVGLNHHILEEHSKDIDQDWLDLHSANHSVDRNKLAALITEGFIDLLPKFERSGFSPFQDAWNARCLYLNQKVRFFNSQSPETDELQGICRGVDESGVLMVETSAGEKISVRDADLSMRLL
ncbi:MAG: biotin--[acetyl-CoA-carboxylase] ligase [Porticoccaceae bacterium]|nr:biotin--[acetyl-CoA-carboxylase] ligase [Porticoccaceae bacterium]